HADSQADVLILGDRLMPIAQAHQHAHRSLGVVRQNLAFAAIYNLTCIPLALVGWMPPWLAGLGMASSSLIVVLNALRLGSLPRDRATQSTDIRAT
ncbi:MAG: cation-transporting P-type ATPase, partial [Burkholderiales bacterium]